MSELIRKLVKDQPLQTSSGKGAPVHANPVVQAPSGVQGKFLLGGGGG